MIEFARPIRGQDENGNVAQLPVRELRNPELPAAHHGHRQIEKNEIRRDLPAQKVERLAAVSRGRPVEPFELQEGTDGIALRRVIFDDENAFFWGTGAREVEHFASFPARSCQVNKFACKTAAKKSPFRRRPWPGSLSPLDFRDMARAASALHPLVCPRCKGPLSFAATELSCGPCRASYPLADGIADFSEGRYYDQFSGPEALSEENLRGLENEREGARIEDFYLPLLRRAGAEGKASAGALRVLDSGCGNGESVDFLNSHGVDAWGHDLSALRRWQWRLRDRPDRLVVADGASLPFPAGFFDAVIASGVLEHIGVAEEGAGRYRVRPLPDRDARRRGFLRELARVTSPGGRILLDFPNGSFPIDFWHGNRPGGGRIHSLREGFLPTARQVRALCRAIDPELRVIALSPLGRLRFRQVSAHWYGRMFRAPMLALQRMMSLPGLEFLAASPINPYLVLEIRRLDARGASERERVAAGT